MGKFPRGSMIKNNITAAEKMSIAQYSSKVEPILYNLMTILISS